MTESTFENDLPMLLNKVRTGNSVRPAHVEQLANEIWRLRSTRDDLVRQRDALLAACEFCQRQLAFTANAIRNAVDSKKTDGARSWLDIADGCEKQASVAANAIALCDQPAPPTEETTDAR